MTIDRRSFLRGSASSIILSRASHVAISGAALSLLAPNQANAWVMAAIAVASTVAGMIAAHNQGDGGVGAMLNANLELTKVAISKLNNIENLLTDVYQQLQDLPDQIDHLLKQESTRSLHLDVLAVVRGYNEKLQNRDPSISIEQWRRDPLTQNDANKLLGRLEAARQKINVQNLTDPSTALIASTICFVEVNLKNLAGYSPYEIIGTIDNVYVPWLDSILDKQQVGSAAEYTTTAKNRLDKAVAAAESNPVGAALKMNPGTTSLLACTGVKDYKADQNIIEQDCIDPTSWQSDLFNIPYAIDIKDDMSRQELALRRCHYDKYIIRGRDGADQRLFISVMLYENEFLVGDIKTGVLTLTLTQSPETLANAGSAGNPNDALCERAILDMPDENSRIATMRGMSTRSTADKHYSELLALVDQINAERARVAFGARTMIACNVARKNLVELRRLYT